MKNLIGSIVCGLLFVAGSAAFAQVTKVETVQTQQSPCFVWGGGSGSQGQFSNCGSSTVITVTKTEVKEVKVPVPVVVIQKEAAPVKKIRE